MTEQGVILNRLLDKYENSKHLSEPGTSTQRVMLRVGKKELPEYIYTNEMAKQCLARNVAYVPGDGFFPDAGHNNCIRLNYSCMPEDKIVEGITKIAEVLKANLK